MSRITFLDVETVRELYEHAKACTHFRKNYDRVETQGLALVHDEGLYLMSTGIPHLERSDKPESSKVAYAVGCHPEADPDCWDNARDLVGGDDFAEYIQLASFTEIFAGDPEVITIDWGDDSFTLGWSERKDDSDLPYDEPPEANDAGQYIESDFDF